MKRGNLVRGGLLISLLMMLSGCTREPEAVGSEIAVTVVADAALYKAIEPALVDALAREVYTPQPEYLLSLNYLPPGEINKVAVRPNIIMAGLLHGEDRVSKQVRGMLPAGTVEQIERGESFVFRKENPWAKKQLLLVLVGTDSTSLREQIESNADYLFEVLRSHIMKRTQEEMYSQYEQFDVEKMLLQKYGWQVRVQHDYHLWKEFPEKQFVMLRRTSPERWLFVTWEENANPDVINKAWVLAKRAQIGRQFYENDRIADRYLTDKEGEFAGRRALILQGLWENEEKVAGGPFKAFAFYDEDARRAYLVDIAVFAPGKEKEVFLRQLEVMARTFQTAADIQRAKNKVSD